MDLKAKTMPSFERGDHIESNNGTHFALICLIRLAVAYL